MSGATAPIPTPNSRASIGSSGSSSRIPQPTANPASAISATGGGAPAGATGGGAGLDGEEALMRAGGQLHADRIARRDLAAFQHHGHDAGLADQLPLRVAAEGRGHQARLEPVEL